MRKLKKYDYELTVLSNVILSPREQEGIFLDSSQKETGNLGNINIIYPFYHYGIYDEYEPKNTEYYIPGSSLKGAIFRGKSKILVDDIKIPNNRIKLGQLNKVQYIPKKGQEESEEEQKQMILNTYFPNIGVEMLKRDEEPFEGSFYSEEDIKERLLELHEDSKRKIHRLIQKVEDSIELNSHHKEKSEKSQDCEETLKKFQNNLKEILNNRKETEYLFFLGGYKGLLLARTFEEMPEKSAIYIDENKKLPEYKALPYGLCKIVLKEE